MSFKKKSGKPYQCWVCNQEFERFVEFTHHIRTGHLGKPVARMSYEQSIEIKPKKEDDK